MIYKVSCGEKLSLLGMGNMRLPTVSPNGPIDEERAQAMIDYVYAQGVNYYDTAYMYHGGESERFVGKALKKYPRDSYYLASKMPEYPLREGKTPQDIFEEQLNKCQVEYFDFYLLHNLNENSVEVFTDEKLGVIPYLLEQKKQGRIKHFGLSSHAKPETLKKFLDEHPEIEFAQIQLNYLDWEMQDAKSQYEIIASHGLPVWVMEPCRGGRLASLSPAADKILKDADADRSIASWAFRWVKSLPAVGMILSGMTLPDQAEDNVKTFSEEGVLTEAEQAVLKTALDTFRSEVNVPCTVCHYCDGCPMGLDIPALLAIYNKFALNKGPFIMMDLNKVPEGKRPENCIACGACLKKCPQNIDIPGAFAKFTEELSKFPAPPKP